jgi:GDPmannose 4,6-dehydratase
MADPTKAKSKLGWQSKHTLDDLIEDMVESDLQLFKKDKILMEHGHDILNYYE